jgi:mRNA interferase MazF
MGGKVRPVVIISRVDPDPPRNLAIYVPITMQNRGSDYEVGLPRCAFLRDGSIANVQGIGSDDRGDRTFFLEKLGDLPESTMKEIDDALLFAIGVTN